MLLKQERCLREHIGLINIFVKLDIFEKIIDGWLSFDFNHPSYCVRKTSLQENQLYDDVDR